MEGKDLDLDPSKPPSPGVPGSVSMNSDIYITQFEEHYSSLSYIW